MRRKEGLMFIFSGMGNLGWAKQGFLHLIPEPLWSLSFPGLFSQVFSQFCEPAESFQYIFLGFSQPNSTSVTYPNIHLTPLFYARTNRNPQTLSYLPEDTRFVSGDIGLESGSFDSRDRQEVLVYLYQTVPMFSLQP